MPIFQAFKRSLEILNKHDHRKLYVAMGTQIFIGFFDTLGVLLIGVITLCATATAQGHEFPSAVKTVIDLLGLGNLPSNQLLGVLGGCAVIMFVVRSVAAPLLLRRILRFLTGRSAEISGQITQKFFNLSLKEVHWETSQRIAFALGSGISAMMGDTLGASVIIVAETSLLIMLSTLLLFIDPAVTIFTLAYFILIMLVIQSILGKWSVRASKQKYAADIAGQSAIQELIASYREIFIGDHVDFYVTKFGGVRRSGAQAQANLQLINYIPKYALEAGLVIGASLLTVFEFITKSPSAAISTLVLFMSAASRMFPSLLRIQGSATVIRGATSASKYTIQILELLKTNDAALTPAKEAPVSIPEFKSGQFIPSLELKDVEFRYEDDAQNVIDGVSTQIKPGSFVALVGPTGSGKSTLVDLMLGVSKPTAGSITISGVAPRDAVKIWPGKIGFVPQLVAMSATSVRENIGLGVARDAIDDAKVWDVLERVRLADLLRESREGLDTEVGERGLRFSGGQRQRLGLARALFTDPSLLVLDEATSALDSETEQAVSQAIDELGSSVTRITIAHRLATVMHADTVIYLDQGRVIASGTFDQVRLAVPEFDQQAKLLGL
jgi:ATP-binding cassette, subfamily B, bacterial PglK